jgi:glycosyltransferase involved in cell wall biosynthesis
VRRTVTPSRRSPPYTTLDIVIPVYNEGANIERTLAEIEQTVATPHRIWIVYDFEQDDTLPAVRRWVAAGRPSGPVELLKNAHGRGALAAIRTGFDAVHDGAVVVMMADLADDMRIVDRMFAAVNEGYEIACGSRYMPEGRQIGGPWLKGQLSRLAGLSLYWLAGLPTRDVTNSFKMYTTRVLRAFPVESDGGFEIGMELLVKAHAAGLPICELPSTWRERTAGQSRFRLARWLPKYLRWYRLALANAWRGPRSGVRSPG